MLDKLSGVAAPARSVGAAVMAPRVNMDVCVNIDMRVNINVCIYTYVWENTDAQVNNDV